jgi:hypothetical protein
MGDKNHGGIEPQSAGLGLGSGHKLGGGDKDGGNAPAL